MIKGKQRTQEGVKRRPSGHFDKVEPSASINTTIFNSKQFDSLMNLVGKHNNKSKGRKAMLNVLNRLNEPNLVLVNKLITILETPVLGVSASASASVE